jgi:hypothetical protein
MGKPNKKIPNFSSFLFFVTRKYLPGSYGNFSYPNFSSFLLENIYRAATEMTFCLDLATMLKVLLLSTFLLRLFIFSPTSLSDR